MRKRIVVFFSMMMAVVMTTGVAMAKTDSGVAQVNKTTYNVEFKGDCSKICARATSEIAYTTIENTSSNKRYIECGVSEYASNIGQTDYVETDEYVLAGIQIDAQIDRDIKLIGYYKHFGSASYNEHAGVLLDNYSYKAYQNQEIVN